MPKTTITTRARDYIRIAKRLPTLNYAAIARIAGVSYQTVQEILSKPAVQQYLRSELDAQSDKAKDSIRNITKSANSVVSRISIALDDPDLSLEAVAALTDRLTPLLNLVERLEAAQESSSQAPQWKDWMRQRYIKLVGKVLARPGLWRRWLSRHQDEGQPTGEGPVASWR